MINQQIRVHKHVINTYMKWPDRTFLYIYLYIECIRVMRHRSDRNMLVKKNNTWLNIFINVHLLVYHTSEISTYLKIYNNFKNYEFRNWDRQVLCYSAKRNLKLWLHWRRVSVLLLILRTTEILDVCLVGNVCMHYTRLMNVYFYVIMWHCWRMTTCV